MENAALGHDAKIFAAKPSDDYVCPLCLNILNNPMQCPNGHCFCCGCITNAVKRREECPICKVALTVNQLGRNIFMNNVINELETLCISNFDCEVAALEHCKWVGKMREREAHYENECGNRRIKCPNEHCSEVLHRMSLLTHSAVCSFRSVKCQHCKTILLYSNVAKHRSVCEMRPVSCPNKCSAVVGKKEIENHLRTTCPLERIVCPFFNINCCVDCCGLVTRNELEAHLVNIPRQRKILDEQQRQLNITNNLLMENMRLSDRVTELSQSKPSAVNNRQDRTQPIPPTTNRTVRHILPDEIHEEEEPGPPPTTDF